MTSCWPKYLCLATLHGLLAAGAAAQTPSIVADLDANPGDIFESAVCAPGDAGPAGIYACGDLVLRHGMPAFRSRNEDHVFSLLYNSRTARPHPLIVVNLRVPAGAPVVPDRVEALLIVDDVPIRSWSIETPGLVAGGSPHRITLEYDASYQPTGAYPYTVRIVSFAGGVARDTVNVEDVVVVVNRINSPYGAGWTVAGTEDIFPAPGGGILLVGDDASWRIYRPEGGGYVAPRGMYRDTIYAVNDPIDGANRRWRRLLDGTVLTYHPSTGRLMAARSPSNQIVRYTWRDTATVRDAGLEMIRLPDVTRRYRLRYSGGAPGNEYLTSVTDPAGRAMNATVTGGRLLSLADPTFNPPLVEIIETGVGSGTASVAEPTRQIPSPGGTVQFGYDALARLDRWTSREGRTTTYEYVNSTALLRKVNMPHGNTWYYTTPSSLTIDHPARDSAIIRMTFLLPNGEVHSHKVNRYGAVTYHMDIASAETVIVYDTTHTLLPVGYSLPNGYMVVMQYDSSARLIQVTEPTHSGGGSTRRYEYASANARHLPTKIVVPRDGTALDSLTFSYYTTGLTRWVRDSRGNRTDFTYIDGLLTGVTGPDGFTAHYEHNSPTKNLSLARIGSRVNVNGFTTTFTQDSAGRTRVIWQSGKTQPLRLYPNAMNRVLTTIVNDSAWVMPVNGTEYVHQPSTMIETNFGYDRDGNLTMRIDPKRPTGAIRRWTYDEIGRILTMTDEFNAVARWTYHGMWLASVTERNGTSTSWVRDARGQDTLRVSVGPAHPSFTVRTSYDIMGRPWYIHTDAGTVSRSFTPEGAIEMETQANSVNGTRSFSYSYLPSGARGTVLTPSNRLVTYRYGPDNLLNEVLYTAPGGTANIDSVALEYDAFGMRRRMHFGFATVNYEHDYNGSLMEATWRNGQSGFLAEGWDDAGRLTRYSVFPGEGVAEITSLAYDNRDQLVMEGTRRYGYDEAGNRVRMSEGTTVTTHTLVRAANGALSDRIHEVRRAMQVGLPTYRYHTYDAAGWLVRDTAWQGGSNWRHVYDAAGQLHTHNWIDPVSPQYRYDGLGRMVNRRQPDQQLVPTWYDGVNSAFHSSNTEYIGTPGVDEQLVVILGTLTCYTVTAGPRMLGMVTSGGLPCGDSTAVHASGGIVRSHSFDLARAKEPLDGEAAGLSFFRNRWYDPRTGRFTQEDPIGYSGGQNLYAYAGNNPAVYTDPFGLCPVCIVAYGVFELGSAAYDIYQTRQAFRRGAGEGAEALHATLIGAIAPGPGNAYRGAARAVDRVIGHHPAYVQLGQQTGAKFFDIPQSVWKGMSSGEQWAANAKFLDRGIAQGARFNLATPLEEVRRGSALEMEINYLLGRGYQLSADRRALIPR